MLAGNEQYLWAHVVCWAFSGLKSLPDIVYDMGDEVTRNRIIFSKNLLLVFSVETLFLHFIMKQI